MILRAYQQDAVSKIRAVWRQRPILQLATGGGKTCIAAEIIRGGIAMKRRSMIVAHTREIVLQTARRFEEYGFDVSCIMAGEPTRPSMVYCASIQTLARRDMPSVDNIIIDECHHATSDSYRRLIAEYPDAFIVGLTATPIRLDGKGLGEVGFGVIVQGVTMEQLIAEGHLVRPRIYSVPVADMSKARKFAGDYSQQSLDDFSSTITGDIVEHWRRLANDTRTIVFACSVTHSQDIVASFVDAGIPALHVDGSCSKEYRADAIAALTQGAAKVLSNCSIFGEGWDLPVLETAILARPTLSVALYRQQCGRVLRASPGKTEAIIIDHAGNWNRHGSPLDELDWTLTGVTKRVGIAPPGKPCPECFVIMPTGCSVCPECGYEFPVQVREPEHVEGTLEEVADSSEIRRAVYANLCSTAWHKRYKIGWARNQYRYRFARWPRKMNDIERQEYPCNEHEIERTQFGARCAWCYRPVV